MLPVGYSYVKVKTVAQEIHIKKYSIPIHIRVPFSAIFYLKAYTTLLNFTEIRILRRTILDQRRKRTGDILLFLKE